MYLSEFAVGVCFKTNGPEAKSLFVPESMITWIGVPGTKPCGFVKYSVMSDGSPPEDVAESDAGIEALA